eukprot:COSAG01_NODE_5364_length_4308_cov_3.542647_2_plen_389_part_00
MVPDPQAGFLVALMLLFPFIIVAGLIVNLNSLPSGFNWLAEISYLRFTFSLIAVNQWDGYGAIACSSRDFEFAQCRTEMKTCDISLYGNGSTAHPQMCPALPANISSITSGNVTGAVTTSTFPTGNHVLHFFGMLDMDASRPWQEYHKRSDGFYDESDRDWFRLCCAILIFRLLGFLAIFLKAKPKKKAGKTATADAAAEAEAMAASTQEGGKSAASGGSWRERAEIHLKWQQLGMTGGDGRAILQNLSGEALPGELLAVVGPSGVGKTCLLKCLAGKQAHSGTRSPPESDALSLQTAYMYQEDLFLTDLTVKEQLLFQAKMRSPEETTAAVMDARVEAAMATVGLSHSATTQIGVIGAGISGGERKRLAFAEQVRQSGSLLSRRGRS